MQPAGIEDARTEPSLGVTASDIMEPSDMWNDAHMPSVARPLKSESGDQRNCSERSSVDCHEKFYASWMLAGCAPPLLIVYEKFSHGGFACTLPVGCV